MIDFTTLQGLTIPEGVVTQITDESGRVIWAVQSGDKVVLQVAKQTLDTYAGETKYTGESFVAIDVYPKTNGTVKVTYGGLTKTIKDTSGAEKPNAQTAYFGTLYGVSDSVETPASGTLTIEGNFSEFGVGTYYKYGSKGRMADYCSCITAVSEWGEITTIPQNAFYNCSSLTSATIGNSVMSIGDNAFYNCSSLTSVVIPKGVTSIGVSTFANCTALSSVVLPEGITIIGASAFQNCEALTRITLPSTLLRIEKAAFYQCDNLDYVVIPASVTYLGHSSLVCHHDGNSIPNGNYYMRSTTPPEMEVLEQGSYVYRAFTRGGMNNIKIWVPSGCGEVYKQATGWSYYAGRIQEEV